MVIFCNQYHLLGRHSNPTNITVLAVKPILYAKAPSESLTALPQIFHRHPHGVSNGIRKSRLQQQILLQKKNASVT